MLEMVPREGVFDGHSILIVGFRDDRPSPAEEC
jgi:hypothetical protein